MNTPMLSQQRNITIPSLPSTILHREVLVNYLAELLTSCNAPTSEGPPRYKLILLQAPAGYGKTTLLIEVARHIALPCCWYLLERSDRDPLTFVRTLLTSLRRQFPDFGEHLIPLFSSTAAQEFNSPLSMLKALLEALTHEVPERFALFLCHYQEISESAESKSLIEYLSCHLPEQGILVLESRELPELDFASLLASRAMLGIGSDRLRFSPQEVQQLVRLQNNRALSIEEAEQLAEVFDGWVTGLLLSTRPGSIEFLLKNWDTPLTGIKPGIQAQRRILFSYVANEVFKHHQQMYTFLKEAAVLQKMTPVLCARLLELTEAEAGRRLHYLEQHGLFVTHKDDEPYRVYTCHPILRDLLYEELRQQNPERFRELHRHASSLLSAQKQYQQAIYHALEANMDEMAACLIITSAEQLMEQERLDMLQHWITAFSPSILQRHPRLLLILLTISIRTGESKKALSQLEQIDTLLAHASPDLIPPEELQRMQMEAALARAEIWVNQGKYQQAQQLCHQVLEQLPPDQARLRARAHAIFGESAGFIGELNTKIERYQKALHCWGRHTISWQTATGHIQLADSYRRLGLFTLAEHHSTRASACWEQMKNTRGNVSHLITRAALLRDQGKLKEAEQMLLQALALSKSLVYTERMQSYVLVHLGNLYQDQGHYERSLENCEKGLALANQLGDVWLLNFALLALARTYVSTGDAATAELLLSEMRVEQKQSFRPLQQVQRELTLGTVRLRQRRHLEALALLDAAAETMNSRGLKEERIRALIRLAVCHLELRQLSAALQQLEELAQILRVIDSYEWLVHSQLRLFPQLRQLLDQEQACASLRALLHWELRTQTSINQQRGAPTPPPLLESPKVAPRLKIIALGEPAVLLNEQPVTHWRMSKAMELCFYLLASQRPLRKEQILAALWQNVDEQNLQTFYSTIHYLRKALGSGAIIRFKGGVYTLDLTAFYSQEHIYYDVAIFEEQYTLACKALEEEEARTARSAFQKMVELYRGDYLQSFYSDWCNLRRNSLRQMYLDARQQLAQLSWQAKEIEESAMHWQQILAVDSCLEAAHYGLMRCYIRQGKRRLALWQYQRYKETLQRELGTAPGLAMQKLYRRLAGMAK